MQENTHVSVTDRSQPLVYYSQKMIEPSSSMFLEVQTRPVLLYSKSPDWLEDVWFQLKTTVIEFDEDRQMRVPAETGPQIDDIEVIEIRKYNSSPPANTINVGRDASNDIVFIHEAISTVHAHLIETESGESFEIIDNNSTNGTRINEEEIPALQNQILINLDQIEFGKVVRAIYLTPRGFYKFLQDLVRTGII